MKQIRITVIQHLSDYAFTLQEREGIYKPYLIPAGGISSVSICGATLPLFKSTLCPENAWKRGWALWQSLLLCHGTIQ